MLSKNEIKDIQSLGHKKQRDELNLFIAEGPKIVEELLQLVPASIEKIYATKDWISNQIKAKQATEINEIELKRISQLQTPNKVLALVKKFAPAAPLANAFTIYLDTIQDPGNFGTIIRTADWFGVKQIVCSSGCADMYNPKVVQSTMASIARVKVYYDEEGNWLAKQNMPVYAAVLKGKLLNEYAKTKEGILVIGNESKGISQEVLQHATDRITIAKKGEAESLNAAVATGIILSHLL